MSTVSAPPDTNHRQQRLITIFWLMAIMLRAFQAWDNRFIMDADVISYLDIVDAYFRGDWNNAINGLWPPPYSWLLGLAMCILKPSPYWEFPVVHLVDFVIYLCALYKDMPEYLTALLWG